MAHFGRYIFLLTGKESEGWVERKHSASKEERGRNWTTNNLWNQARMNQSASIAVVTGLAHPGNKGWVKAPTGKKFPRFHWIWACIQTPGLRLVEALTAMRRIHYQRHGRNVARCHFGVDPLAKGPIPNGTFHADNKMCPRRATRSALPRMSMSTLGLICLQCRATTHQGWGWKWGWCWQRLRH